MPPNRDRAVVGKFGRFAARVAAQDDLIEIRERVLLVALEPFFLDHAAAERRWRLLVLTGEVVLADRRARVLERLGRFERLVENAAFAALKGPRSPRRIDPEYLVDLRDRRQR